jgi:tetratricopeptide (TPR) repeat protein
VADEPWAVASVARLTEMRDQLRELLVESLLAVGAPDRALLELEPALAESPLRERLHALRMRAQHRLGRTEEALRTYQQARTLLRDELGLEPGPGLRETHAGILADDPPPCGTEFDIAVVQSAVTAAPPLFTSDEVFTALAGWTAGGVVEPLPRSMTRYRFRDPGQSAALARGVEPAARADAHHRLGEAVERRGGVLRPSSAWPSPAREMTSASEPPTAVSTRIRPVCRNP